MSPPSRFMLANAIRALSMDAVQKANSGHPGMPMGMADIAEVLWNDFLRHNPGNPTWPNRDRFILSNGHGCMLQYALLHLTGYDLSIEDLKQFRQLHSKTPGHPEHGYTPGVETTTGPLGQGFANSVGIALAERIAASYFNREHFSIVDHYTYCFVGDGCLMEGISHEVASLAGTLGLGKLIVFYDDNGISIDGEVKNWFMDDTPRRFEAYNWQVLSNIDGHDPDAIKNAVIAAQLNPDKPSLICCKTVIGFGAPKLAGTAKVHGSPLGAAEIVEARKKLNWSSPAFEVPKEIYQAWDKKTFGAKLEADWKILFENYRKDYPDLAEEFERRKKHALPVSFEKKINEFIQQVENKKENIASRKASQNTLEILLPLLPELLGGSADLSESNLTHCSASKDILPHHFNGNYVYYGVREFGMFAMMNGMALYDGFIPYGGTFLTFLDYGRNAVRLSAFMKEQVIYVFTHDSIGLGEDGPTHQPIEHLNMLRMTPNMSLWRPCDATETAVAWKMAIERKSGPTSLALSRQPLPHQNKTSEQLALIEKGGYVLLECEKPIHAIIIATGSEVHLAVQAAKQLQKAGKNIRVVSLPSTDVFLSQDVTYQASVLPPKILARIAIEAGATSYWYRFVGLSGKVLGLDRFGESAPQADIFKALGFTVDQVIETVETVVKQSSEYSA